MISNIAFALGVTVVCMGATSAAGEVYPTLNSKPLVLYGNHPYAAKVMTLVEETALKELARLAGQKITIVSFYALQEEGTSNPILCGRANVASQNQVRFVTLQDRSFWDVPDEAWRRLGCESAGGTNVAVEYKSEDRVSLMIRKPDAPDNPPSSIADKRSAASATVSENELRQTILKFRTYKPKDQFDAPLAMTGLVNRRFQIDIPLRSYGPSNQICTGTPWYGYLAEQHKLRIMYGSGEASASSSESLFHPKPRFAFDCVVSHQTQPESNGFGAVRRVDVTREQSNAFEASNLSGEMEWRQLDLDMNGNTARELVKTLRLRVAGTIEAWSAGHLIQCKSDTTDATMALPMEIHKSACVIKAAIDVAEIIDIKNGNIVATLPFADPASRLHSIAIP